MNIFPKELWTLIADQDPVTCTKLYPFLRDKIKDSKYYSKCQLRFFDRHKFVITFNKLFKKKKIKCLAFATTPSICGCFAKKNAIDIRSEGGFIYRHALECLQIKEYFCRYKHCLLKINGSLVEEIEGKIPPAATDKYGICYTLFLDILTDDLCKTADFWFTETGKIYIDTDHAICQGILIDNNRYYKGGEVDFGCGFEFGYKIEDHEISMENDKITARETGEDETRVTLKYSGKHQKIISLPEPVSKVVLVQSLTRGISALFKKLSDKEGYWMETIKIRDFEKRCKENVYHEVKDLETMRAIAYERAEVMELVG